jgi:hypothetical protein
MMVIADILGDLRHKLFLYTETESIIFLLWYMEHVENHFVSVSVMPGKGLQTVLSMKKDY